MSVQALDRFTIRPADLQRSIDFYVRVLGLHVGERPAFDFPGAWLWNDTAPVVHLVGGVPHDVTAASKVDATDGLLHHIAFSCTDLDAMRARLVGLGITFREAVVPTGFQIQLFVIDPDGVQLELNFAL